MGYSQTMADAVAYAIGKGIVVVAAAGNSGADVTHFYPASLPGVVAVSAADKYSIAWWSNWGSSIKVAAPGVSILSTLPGNKYASWSGTSMATPHVSGYAAFLKAKSKEDTFLPMRG